MFATCATVPAFPFPRHYLIDFADGTIRARQLDLRTGTLSGPTVPIYSSLKIEEPPPGEARTFFTASNNGVLAARPSFGSGASLAWYDRRGNKLSDLPPGAWPALSPDEKQLIVLRAGVNWLIDLPRAAAMRLAPDLAYAGLAAWSPDGKRIAVGGGGEIVELNAADTAQRRTILRTSNWLQQYSPDGKNILFMNLARMSLDLVDISGTAPPIQLAPPGPSYFPANFSPDGRFISYSSSESGRLEVYVRAVPPASGKWLVSNNGGGMAAWRGDGRELFYLSSNLDMMSVDVSTSPTFQASTPKPLFRAKVSGNNNSRNNYVVSRDGQRFLIVSPSPDSTPLTVVVNWPALLQNP
jgi:Tol biopolymer transport system component